MLGRQNLVVRQAGRPPGAREQVLLVAAAVVDHLIKIVDAGNVEVRHGDLAVGAERDITHRAPPTTTFSREPIVPAKGHS